MANFRKASVTISGSYCKNTLGLELSEEQLKGKVTIPVMVEGTTMQEGSLEEGLDVVYTCIEQISYKVFTAGVNTVRFEADPTKYE